MGQSLIGDLRVALGLDSAKFSKGADNADRSLKKMKMQFAAVAGAAAAFGVALSTAALAGAKQIDEAAKAARRLDSSIGGFRALELSAGEAGVSLSGLTNDIQTMNRELASVGVSGNGKRALEALGLELSDLQGIDADEKLAVIADRVKALGLSSGKTTAILRDLGVRNREMALLVLQGGGAIRNARADIKAYGLEVSKVDAGAIETANDQIGRLGLIGQYAGQQLAIALVPALGAMAKAMTDSLKEGGLLRIMIDGLVANIGTITSSLGIFVGVVGVKLVAAMAAAAGATGVLSGAFLILSRAIFATGFGAVIIGAGYAVAKFAELVRGAGGFGEALDLLADVASAAFEDMGTGLTALGWKARAVADGFVAAFLNAFAKIRDIAGETLNEKLFGDLSDPTNLWGRMGLKGFDFGNGDALREQAGAFEDASDQASANASSLWSGANRTSEAWGVMKDAMAATRKEAERTSDVTGDLNDVLDETGAAGGKAAKGVNKTSKALTEAEKEAKRLREEMQRPLVNAIGGVADAFGDFMTRGFKDFKGFVGSVLGSFKQMLSQMISTAARNRIMLSMGISGGGAGTAAAGVPGVGQVGGGGGGLLSGLGGIGSSFISGASGLFSSFMGGGGFSAAGTYLSSVLGTATTSVGAFAAAAGAIAVPLLAVAAVFSFFKKKVTELDAGLRITVDGMDALVETFRTIETKRFWGLSKKVGTSYSEAADDVAAPLQKAIGDIGKSIMEMGTFLGFDAANIDLASFQFNISTKGKTEEEIQKAIADEMGRLSDVFADAMVGSFDEVITKTTNIFGGNPLSGLFGKFLNRDTTETISHVNEEFEALKRVGEGSFDALQRIVTSLQAVNPMMDALGLQLYDLSLVGGDAASSFVDLFGSLQDFGTITGAYYQEFFTAQERTAKATQRLTKELSALGINALPGSRAAFRALVDEADSLGDTELVAALIKLSPAFADITAASDALSESLANNALFKTKADEIYARTAGGYLASIEDIQTAAGGEMIDLLREVVRAIREGDVNTARLLGQQVNQQRRAALEPGT